MEKVMLWFGIVLGVFGLIVLPFILYEKGGTKAGKVVNLICGIIIDVVIIYAVIKLLFPVLFLS